MGVDKWIDEQLHPEKINDNALEARLSSLRTLRMSTKEIIDNFPPPQLIKTVEQGKQTLPSDPVKRAVYESQMEKLEQKQEKKQAAANDGSNNADNAATDQFARPREDRPMRRLRLPIFVFARLVADDGGVPGLREARPQKLPDFPQSQSDTNFIWKR